MVTLVADHSTSVFCVRRHCNVLFMREYIWRHQKLLINDECWWILKSLSPFSDVWWTLDRRPLAVFWSETKDIYSSHLLQKVFTILVMFSVKVNYSEGLLLLFSYVSNTHSHATTGWTTHDNHAWIQVCDVTKRSSHVNVIFHGKAQVVLDRFWLRHCRLRLAFLHHLSDAFHAVQEGPGSLHHSAKSTCYSGWQCSGTRWENVNINWWVIF